MTKKLYEAYKAGTWKPYNRYFIETFKEVFIPGHIFYSCPREIYSRPAMMSTHLPVNDMETVSVTFNGPWITWSINCHGTYLDPETRKYYTELLPAFTVTTHYKNIKRFQ